MGYGHGQLLFTSISKSWTITQNTWQEAEFDLATTIKGAGYYRRSRKTDFVSDYLPPTPDELQQAINRDRYISLATYTFRCNNTILQQTVLEWGRGGALSLDQQIP